MQLSRDLFFKADVVKRRVTNLHQSSALRFTFPLLANHCATFDPVFTL